MQPTTIQVQAAEYVANGQVSFNPMTGAFTVAGAHVDGADFYRCYECASNKCAHSLAAQVIDGAFDKAREARRERVLEEYIQVIGRAQDMASVGFELNTLEIERRAAYYVKQTSRGLQMPIPQTRASIAQEVRLKEVGGNVAGLSYAEAKAEILRLEWDVWR